MLGLSFVVLRVERTYNVSDLHFYFHLMFNDARGDFYGDATKIFMLQLWLARCKFDLKWERSVHTCIARNWIFWL